MASQSILRAGVRSPVHALMKPASTRSILKKPAPLPLSQKPLPFAASFSVVINSPQPSPHVHFPSSPAMAAVFTAYSPTTYNRGPITISPESPGVSGWANRQLSPSAHNAFKLLAPPQRKAQAQNTQLLTVPACEDPRSPKPYKEVCKAPAATQQTQFLSVPGIEDPRSPKPYKPRAGVNFQELTLHVPRPRLTRGAEELGKALSTYPRSPYPSAPIEEDLDTDMDIDSSETPARGRLLAKPGKLQSPPRARSLDKGPKSRSRPSLHVASPLRQSFLSSATESAPAIAKSTPAPLDLLETQFWESVTLEGAEPESAYVTANEIPASESESVSLHVPNIMFGSKDGQLWSPIDRLQRKDVHRDRIFGADIGSALSPAQRMVLSKGMMASPSPNDPFAAFPSFTIAMMSGMEGNITYPPRARVVREM